MGLEIRKSQEGHKDRLLDGMFQCLSLSLGQSGSMGDIVTAYSRNKVEGPSPIAFSTEWESFGSLPHLTNGIIWQMAKLAEGPFVSKCFYCL